MNLRGAVDALELTILGYQFPARATEPYDSNWLNVRVRASAPRGEWTAEDPCLLTYEAARLADWLEAVAREADGSDIRFMEPALALRVRDARVEAVLAFELRPPWCSLNEAATLVFDRAPAAMARAAETLRVQLEQYPPRADR